MKITSDDAYRAISISPRDLIRVLELITSDSRDPHPSISTLAAHPSSQRSDSRVWPPQMNRPAGLKPEPAEVTLQMQPKNDQWNYRTHEKAHTSGLRRTLALSNPTEGRWLESKARTRFALCKGYARH